MMNDHPRAGVGHNSTGCAVCTAIDREGLVERLAEELWESRQDDTQWARSWANAGELWHIRFRELAQTAIAFLKQPEVMAAPAGSEVNWRSLPD